MSNSASRQRGCLGNLLIAYSTGSNILLEWTEWLNNFIASLRKKKSIA